MASPAKKAPEKSKLSAQAKTKATKSKVKKFITKKSTGAEMVVHKKRAAAPARKLRVTPRLLLACPEPAASLEVLPTISTVSTQEVLEKEAIEIVEVREEGVVPAPVSEITVDPKTMIVSWKSGSMEHTIEVRQQVYSLNNAGERVAQVWPKIVERRRITGHSFSIHDLKPRGLDLLPGMELRIYVRAISWDGFESLGTYRDFQIAGTPRRHPLTPPPALTASQRPRLLAIPEVTTSQSFGPLSRLLWFIRIVLYSLHVIPRPREVNSPQIKTTTDTSK